MTSNFMMEMNVFISSFNYRLAFNRALIIFNILKRCQYIKYDKVILLYFCVEALFGLKMFLEIMLIAKCRGKSL
jgi:ribonucleotide reductase beta subunit family protein with ferritin-like domain